MKLIQCRFSSGQRLPLLVQAGDATPLPILIPFIYVQLKLRHRAYNTAAAHLRAIQAFYSYAKSRYLDKGCALRQGDAWHRVRTAQLKPSSLIVTAPLLVCTDLQDSVIVMALHN